MASKALLDFETSEGRPYTEAWVDNGRMYLVGHPYPLKCVPRIEAIGAVNLAKRNILFPVKASMLLTSALVSTIDLAPFAREFTKLVYVFNKPLSGALGQIFHYDEAYRFRLQDLFAETTAERLSLWPCAEILRLLKINKERDHKFAHRKFALAAYALVLFFLWPPNRTKLREALKMIDYAKLLSDEGDKYWMSKKIDYRYGGLTNQVV